MVIGSPDSPRVNGPGWYSTVKPGGMAPSKSKTTRSAQGCRPVRTPSSSATGPSAGTAFGSVVAPGTAHVDPATVDVVVVEAAVLDDVVVGSAVISGSPSPQAVATSATASAPRRSRERRMGPRLGGGTVRSRAS